MYKKIGIIGGLSPESTVTYYLHMTRKFNESFGGSTCPEIIIYSVNLENYHIWRNQNRWDLITEDITRCSNKLHEAGAKIGLIATNTMHKVFDEVSKKTDLPLINMLETVSNEIITKKIKTVGLIGTKFTMNDGFYHDHLSKQNINTITPSDNEKNYIHDKIEKELVKGQFLKETKNKFQKIIENLKSEGAEGIILGCTEIPLLIKQEDCTLPVIDTALVHADNVVNQIINN